jgi:hypothetical protein
VPRAPSAPRPPDPAGPQPAAATPAAVPPRPAPPPGPGASGAPMPTRDELTLAWGDGVLRGLSGKAKAYLGSGRFVSVHPDGAVYAVPNQQWLSRSLDVRAEAETALAARFGRPVPLKLVVEAAIPSAAAPADSDKGTEELDRAGLDHLQDADVEVISPEQRLMDAFPGAEEVST